MVVSHENNERTAKTPSGAGLAALTECATVILISRLSTGVRARVLTASNYIKSFKVVR
jgi:hypothetical protein